MRDGFYIAAIIPALDEAETVGRVIDALPDWVDRVIVADNGSSDGTAGVAAVHGARVVFEPRRGYGAACLKAMQALPDLGAPDHRVIVVFLDGDLSDDPAEAAALVDPIAGDGYDFVLGSRVDGPSEAGALSAAQRFGSYLASFLIKVLYDADYRDLGPFRAVRWDRLRAMRMDDPDYGWTVQMQVRAAKLCLRTLEVPVRYRNRAGGRSKVSGTLRGVFGAGTTILKVIFKEAKRSPDADRSPVGDSVRDTGRRIVQWWTT